MKPPTIRALVLWSASGLAGCATYEPAPLEVRAILDQLESVSWNAAAVSNVVHDAAPASAVPAPMELAAFAVQHNPGLMAVRASWDVRQSLLVEAGLLPDVELGWDGMDWLAGELSGTGADSVDGLAGFGLMFPLLRPGELDAREGAARGELRVAKERIRAAEWQLSLDVLLACENLAAAHQLVSRTEELAELLHSTSDFFVRAKQAGTVTAIAANLACGEYQAMRLDALRAGAEVLRARQGLNSLLGLPPNFQLLVGPGELAVDRAELQLSLADLTEHGMDHRPDLELGLALYEVSEQELRLAVAQQYPQLAIGTGIQLSLPILSGFGQSAIETARVRREQTSRELKARVHQARQEIAAEYALWSLLREEVRLVDEHLLPNAEETLALSQASFGAGEITLLETLELQRALVKARTRRIESHAARARQAWKLLAVSGWLLGPNPSTEQQPDTDS